MKNLCLAVALATLVLAGCVQRRAENEARSAPGAPVTAPADNARPPAPVPPSTGATAPVAMPAVVTLDVSDYDLNDFVFSAPIKNGPVFPTMAVLKGKPLYLANNTQVLVQFEKGVSQPFQMVVETNDGVVHVLRLVPRAIVGTVYRVN